MALHARSGSPFAIALATASCTSSASGFDFIGYLPSSIIASFDLRYPSVLRGLSLSFSVGSSRWSSEKTSGSAPSGKYRRSGPLVFSLVPRGAVPGIPGKSGHLADDGIPHAHGVVAVRQVREDGEPDGTLHEGADGTAVAGPANEGTVFGPTVVPRPSRAFGHSNHAGRLDEVHVR